MTVMPVKGPGARSTVIREALIFTPIAIALLVAWIAIVLFEGSAIPALVMVGFLLVLVGFQSVQAVRDLFSAPQVTRGTVARKWSHMLVHRGHFVYVGKEVFDIGPLAYHQLKPGDPVAVTHYPHTNVVVSIEKEKETTA